MEKDNKKTIEETYQKKTQLEHILLRPDSYIGSTEPLTETLWVVDDTLKRFVYREVTIVPGLLKIFDEVLVNAADNKQRDPTMNKIEVTISAATSTISVWNNGACVPVVMHEKELKYVPELVFGEPRTGSNFDDGEKKVTGGRNGLGAKLTNIFSVKFVVVTNDTQRGLAFRQEFTENMTKRSEPVITKATGKRDFTCITFTPDLKRFKMMHLDADIVAVLRKRVFDMAGISDRTLKVTLDGEPVPVTSFKDYVTAFQSGGVFKELPAKKAKAVLQTQLPTAEEVLAVDEVKVEADAVAVAVSESKAQEDAVAEDLPVVASAPFVYERIGERWEIAVGVSDGQFRQVSFVNAICTTKGGSHVNAIVDKIAEVLAEKATKKARSGKGVDIKPFQVKPHMSVFVNCLIENPAFDSQTKDTLTTRQKDFGSVVVIPDAFMKRACKLLIDRVMAWARFKETAELVKISGTKKVNLRGIPKLDDANFAGGARAERCTLILTEGDSAKTLAISGLSVVGRDCFGVFPLKGKPLNVRDCGMAKMMDNAEIQAIVDIIGLKFNVVYTKETLKTLRYGSVMVMADQDHDGSHIKGLIINFIHAYWPSLFQIKGFLCEFITPIVRCSRGPSTVLSFYTMPEYQAWQALSENERGWTVKYYKGLGTSSATEAREYFRSIDRHRIDFEYEGPASDAAMVLAFDKKHADERKAWLLAVEEGTFVDYSKPSMPYSVFVNDELSLFSLADNIRSIPSAIDGLKPSQRKILFGCFRRKLTAEVKVAQLTGYIGEHAMYHHGEISLANTIVGMAQRFVGSNNVNLLYPSGQFGTRLMGGSDSASSRYIFTKLSTVTRSIFDSRDDAILTPLKEDGVEIEPKWYLPVIPMALVNGGSGVGTGWSTDVPSYNPLDLIAAVRAKLCNTEAPLLVPWFKGFTGKVVAKDATHFYTTGHATLNADTNTVTISELPVGVWTQPYKAFLEGLMTGAHSSASAAGKAKAKGGAKARVPAKPKSAAAIAKAAKCEAEAGAGTGTPATIATKTLPAPSTGVTVLSVTDNSTEDSVLFQVKVSPETAERLGSEQALLKAFHLEASFTTTNMHLFDAGMKIRKYDSPEAVLDAFFVLRRQYYGLRHQHLVKVLTEEWARLDNKMRFLVMVTDGTILVTQAHDDLVTQLSSAGFAVFDGDAEYDYLLSIPIRGLTLERVKRLEAERDAKMRELKDLESQTPDMLWESDLSDLEKQLSRMDTEQATALRQEAVAAGNGKTAATTANKPAKKRERQSKSKAVVVGCAVDASETGVALKKLKAEV